MRTFRPRSTRSPAYISLPTTTNPTHTTSGERSDITQSSSVATPFDTQPGVCEDPSPIDFRKWDQLMPNQGKKLCRSSGLQVAGISWTKHPACLAGSSWPARDKLRVPRIGPGRPRNRPGSGSAHKAYSNWAILRGLRQRKIRHRIPKSRQHRRSTPPWRARSLTSRS
jgi:hypothetical protein